MDLQPYSHDCFSKILRTLFDFRNNTYWVSLFQRNNLLIFRTGVSCFSATLFYSTLFAITDRRNDCRRVKYTRYAWAGGTFFPVVLLCQFLVPAGNRFWFYILLMYLEYHTVVVLCQFFLIWREILIRTYLVYNTVVRLCQFFCCGGKANLVRFFLLNPRIFFSCFLLCMDLQPYSQDCFSIISRTLFDFQNNTYWVSFRNNSLIFRTGVSCFFVTLFFSTLLALTDGQND